jgi:4-amino-4-deoxy-L-arabinose transferase-like glycosyltransferase
MLITQAPAQAGIGPLRGIIAFVVAVALLAIWLLPIAARDLMETDEGRYAEISREMVVSGDWVTPRLDGLKYFEKPPLQYWATALVFEVAGQSTFTARFYTALCALLSVLAVWATARRLWGRQAGDYAGLATASMVWMLGGSQVPSLDMSLTLYLTLILCGFLIAEDPATAAPARRWWMLGVWAAIAAAVLTKGLIGLLIPGATLVLYCLLRRDLSLLWRMEWLRGLPLMLLIAAPWFVLVAMRNDGFLHFFFIREHVERFLTTEHHRAGPLYYFVPLLLGGSLPWMPLLPAAFRHAYQAAPPMRASLQLLLVWCVFVFAFFSLSGSKLPFYILPLFPAIGLLLGPYLLQMPLRGLRALAIANALLWLVAAIAAPLALGHRKGSDDLTRDVAAAFEPWALAGGLIIASFAAAAAWQAMRERRTAAIVLLSVGSLIGLQTMATGFHNFSVLRSTRELADRMLPLLKPGTEVFTLKAYDQTLPFYLQRLTTVVAFSGELEMGQKEEPGKWIPDMDEFRRRWEASPDAIAVASPKLVRQLQQQGLPLQVVASTPRRIAFRKPDPRVPPPAP